MIRTALLSFWHFHTDKFVRQLRELPGVELVAAWDSDPARARAGGERYGLEIVADLDVLLARQDIDAVLVQTPTTDHLQVITAAARAGKHIFTDKVLATTTAEANQIVQAVQEAGVVMVVAMPQLYHDYIRRTQEIIASGALGTVVNVRMMNGHGMAIEKALPDGFFEPREAGGGALMDMCHMLYVTPTLFGKLPSSAYATFGYFTQDRVDDSALAVYTFDDGAHASIEAGFVTRGAPRFELEVNGTQGSVQFVADSHPGGAGATPDSFFRGRFGDEKHFSPIPLGTALPTPMELWVAHIESGEPASENVSAAVDLSTMVESAYLSAARGAVVSLADLRA